MQVAADQCRPPDELSAGSQRRPKTSIRLQLFVVADVVGHGVPAAMNAAMLRRLLMQAAESFNSPAEVLAFINRRFTSVSLTGHFVTKFLTRVNSQNGSLDYASAGHEAAWLLFAEGSIRELPSTGLLLGIEEDATWEEAINVGGGSRLMMVTDGVCETCDSAGNMFGRNRLVDLFVDCRQLTLLPAADRLSDILSAFRDGTPQLDDVTAVLIEWTDERSRNNAAG